MSMMIGQNGILSNAQTSVRADTKARELETIKTSALAAITNSSSKGNISLENGYFDQELKNEFGEGNYMLEEKTDKFIVTVAQTGNSYEVDRFGKVSDQVQTGGKEEDNNSIKIAYTIENLDSGSKVVVLSYPEEELTEDELKDNFAKAIGFANLDEYLLAAEATEEEFDSMIQEEADDSGMSFKDYLKDFIVGQGGEISPSIEAIAQNGTHKINGILTEFIATRNGKYTVTATRDGRTGKVEVDITGIEEEKFSKIYDETTIYRDSSQKIAYIPAGFAVGISDNIKTIENGLVITDKVDSEGYSIGNEFVWIPVSGESDLERTYFDETTGNPTGENPGYDEPYKSGYSDGSGTEEIDEYNEMKSKVLEYNGFYIGRYEVGIDSATIRKKMFGYADSNMVIKKGMAPYNWVPWGNSISDINSNVQVTLMNGSTIEVMGAVKLAKSMYNTSTSVVSTLCYGTQWDAMCRYIEDSNRSSEEKSYVDLTGSVADDNSKNIYDLAGNCDEWTMEAYSRDNERLVRGGYYETDTSDASIYTRYHASLNHGYPGTGFRCALYIK